MKSNHKRVVRLLRKKDFSSSDYSRLRNTHISDELFKTQWNSSKIIPEEDRIPSFSKIMDQIQSSSEKSHQGIKVIANRLLRYAAVFVLAFILFSAGYLTRNYILGKNPLTYVESPKGVKSEIRLPDNSRVWLNTASSLVYPSQFSQDTIILDLEGEAYFKINSNPNRTLIVRSGDFKVSSLGTEFFVKAIPGREFIEAGLVNGKILISAPGIGTDNSLIVEENNAFIYSSREQRMISEMACTSEHYAWMEGKLIFDDKTLSDIASDLGNWCNAEINVSREIQGKYRFTLTVTNESVEEILELLKLTSPIEYTKDTNGVFMIISKPK
jgi:ferric-dicitrate binding protein FerR (iron transport regulator)